MTKHELWLLRHHRGMNVAFLVFGVVGASVALGCILFAHMTLSKAFGVITLAANVWLISRTVQWIRRPHPELILSAMERFLVSEPAQPGMERPSITCTSCGKTSFSPLDLKFQYCGYCHRFHDETDVPK